MSVRKLGKAYLSGSERFQQYALFNEKISIEQTEEIWDK